MEPELVIDRQTGALLLGEANSICANRIKPEVEAQTSRFAQTWRDLKNGYEWLNPQGLRFGSLPCALGICFRDQKISEARWSVSLPEAEMEGGWPTRKAIDQEIQFVRKILKQQLGKNFGSGVESFSWGSTWSQFDQKGFLASNGLRYGA